MRRLALLSFLLFTACNDSPEPVALAGPNLDPVFTNGATYDCTAQSEIPTLECQALVAFYNSTDGDNWFNNSGWLVTSTPCSWNGVSCTSGHVTSLGFHHGANFLTGVLPSELGNLTSLERLIINSNSLTGAIPDTLGSLAYLRVLELHNNQFSGPIPNALGNLDSLRVLTLYDNQLSGSIPATLGNLSSLGLLRLYRNNLSGPIPPQLGQLSNLGGLSLSENQLSGPIPSSLGSLANLSVLSLGDNNLSGTIPWQLGNLSNLQSLSLEHNNLSGPIPVQLAARNFDEAYLGRYELNDNDLSGLVPLGVAEADTLAGVCELTNNDLYVPDTPAYRALSGSGTDICGLPLSPPEDVTDNVIDQVGDLVSDGTLNQGQGSSLTSKLSAARKKMDSGQYQTAINILYAFITQVGDFVTAGKLSAAEGQWLIDQANILIAQCTALL